MEPMIKAARITEATRVRVARANAEERIADYYTQRYGSEFGELARRSFDNDFDL